MGADTEPWEHWGHTGFIPLCSCDQRSCRPVPWISFCLLRRYSSHGEDNEDPKERLHSQVSGNSQLHSRAASPPSCLITSSKPLTVCLGWVRSLGMHFKCSGARSHRCGEALSLRAANLLLYVPDGCLTLSLTAMFVMLDVKK